MDVLGELRHRIEIYSISSSIDSDYGGESSYSEVLYNSAWAAWEPKESQSGEKVDAGQKDDLITINWKIRYNSGVKSNMLIKYEGIYHNIISVLPDNKRCYMMIESEQVGENWTKV